MLLACIVLIWIMRQHHQATRIQSARRAGKPVPVDVFEVHSAALDFSIPVECVSMASENMPIYAYNHYNEVVSKRWVKTGDRVKKNQLLLELDAQQEQLELQAAMQRLQALRKELDEGYKKHRDWSKKNRARGFGLEREYLQATVDWLHAQTLIEQARSDIRLKQLQLKRKQLRAPVEGLIVDIVNSGQATLNGSIKLATVAVNQPLLLDCPLQEEQVRFVQAGDPVQARFYAWPGQNYTGQVAYIYPLADAARHSVSIRVELANATGVLLPGLHSLAQIKQSHTGLRVPSIALMDAEHAGQKQVFRVNQNNQIELQRVETGMQGQGFTEIKRGLQTGDRVVVAGQFDLRPGDKVRVASVFKQEDIGRLH